jgi:hypothetical protein
MTLHNNSTSQWTLPPAPTSAIAPCSPSQPACESLFFFFFLTNGLFAYCSLPPPLGIDSLSPASTPLLSRHIDPPPLVSRQPLPSLASRRCPLPSRCVDAPSPQAASTPLPSASIPPSPASMPCTLHYWLTLSFLIFFLMFFLIPL